MSELQFIGLQQKHRELNLGKGYDAEDGPRRREMHGSIKSLGPQTKTLLPGNYRYSSITLSGGSKLILSGPSIIHIDGDLKVSGGHDGNDGHGGNCEKSEQSSIVIASGSVTIYANGKKIDFSGGSLINNTQDPMNLTIYGTARLQSVNLSGRTNQHLLLYAPTAAITLSGGQNTFGSVIGRTVNISGGSSVHYDEILSYQSSRKEALP